MSYEQFCIGCPKKSDTNIRFLLRFKFLKNMKEEMISVKVKPTFQGHEIVIIIIIQVGALLHIQRGSKVNDERDKPHKTDNRTSENLRENVTAEVNGFGGLEVACWPLVSNFAGSNPAKKKIVSTPSFGRE